MPKGRFRVHKNPPPAPSRSEVTLWLHRLIAGDITRKEVDEWACQWVYADDPGVDDEVVWNVLTALCGADMPSTDREFLFGEEDFRAWLDELMKARSETMIAFVEDLVHRFPNLRPLYEEHVSDFDEILSHVFFGDVTRYVVDLFLRWQAGAEDPDGAEKELRNLLQFLEDSYRDDHGGDIDELIAVSFLEALPRPQEEPGWEIRSLIGPEMTKQLHVIG